MTLCDKCGNTFLTDTNSLPNIDSLKKSAIQHKDFPTEAERTTINEAIIQQDGLLRQIDTDIQNLNQKVEEALMARETLVETRGEFVALVAPIKRIPTEILREIMTWRVHQDPDWVKRTRVSLSLTEVSNLWRTVAFSTFELWRYLSLGSSSSFALASFQLSITNPTPVDVTIMSTLCWNRDYDVSDPEKRSHFTFLANHASRWRFINFPPYGAGGEVYPPINFPALEMLCLGAHVGIESSSLLRSITLLHVCSVKDIAVPWNQITDCSLRASWFTLDDCLEILEICPQLRKLSFEGSTNVPVSLRPTPVIHYHLLELHILPPWYSHEPFIDESAIPTFLNSVSLVALESFTIYHVYGIEAQSMLATFLSIRSAPLRTLTLRECSHPRTIAALYASPSLTRLFLDFEKEVDLTQCLLELKQDDTHEPPLLPLLEHLTLCGSEFRLEHIQPLTDVIESRWKGRRHPNFTSLRSVAIYIHWHYHWKSLVDPLSYFNHHGFNVSVFDLTSSRILYE